MPKKTSKEDEDTVTLQKSVLRGLMDCLTEESREAEKSDKLEEDEEVMPNGRLSR